MEVKHDVLTLQPGESWPVCWSCGHNWNQHSFGVPCLQRGCECRQKRSWQVLHLQTKDTPAILIELFKNTSDYDPLVLEIANALLHYTDRCVERWRELEVPECDIEAVVDAASLYRDRSFRLMEEG